MELTVKFKNDELGAIYIKEYRHGLNDVEKIRKETIKSLSLEKIEKYSAMKSIEQLEIVVSENLAKKSGLFQECGCVTVYVASQQLNKYCIKKVFFCQTDTGEYKNCRIIWDLDEEKLLKAWEKAGFPLDWSDDNNI